MDKEYNEELQIIFCLKEPPLPIQSVRRDNIGQQNQSYLKHNVFCINNGPMIYNLIFNKVMKCE